MGKYMPEIITPVLLIGYKRPSLIRESLHRLQEMPVNRIYVAVDGAKDDLDRSKVDKTRKVVIDFSLATGTPTYHLFSEKNIGCRLFPEKAITWFFENEDFGIVLEDDIILSESFFRFARSYGGLAEVSVTSACSYPELAPEIKKESAFLTRIPSIWGWASKGSTWREYIEKKDGMPKSFIVLWVTLAPKIGLAKGLLFALCLNMVYEEKLAAWDYIFAYYLITCDKLTVMPSVRMACNIGFNSDATHNNRAHNPTLPFDINAGREESYCGAPKLNRKHERIQALNTPFYNFFYVHAIKGLIRYCIDSFLSAWIRGVKKILKPVTSVTVGLRRNGG